MHAKRTLTRLTCFLVFACLPLVAGAAGLSGALPAAGIFFDIFPMFELSDRTAVPDGYAMTADDLAAFQDRPAFVTAGFSLCKDWFSAAMTIEFHQDPGVFLLGGSWSNLPKSVDSWMPLTGNNYPQVGYAQAKGEGWLLSLGRRRLNLGPGVYSLSISGGNPSYDHALAGIGVPLGKGEFGYAFSALSVARPSQKMLFMHRVSYGLDRFSVALTELNLVTGTEIDFEDIGPFLVYHHLFKPNSNVMLDLEMTARPVQGLKVYGEVLVDDIQIGSEGSTSNPNAAGFLAGLSWKALPGSRSARPAMFRGDHGLRLGDDRTTGSDGGLSFRLESYLASTYLYRRNASRPDEAYTTHYFLQSSTSIGWPTVESWFAYPLGPDTWLNRLEVTWADGGLESSASVEYRILGAQSGLKTYTFPYAASWLGPQDPVTRRVDLVLQAVYAMDSRMMARGKASVGFGDSGFSWSVSAGLGFRVGFGAVPVI